MITGSMCNYGISSTKGVSAGSVVTSIFIYNFSQLYFGQSELSSYFKKTLTVVLIQPGSNKSFKSKTPLKII